MHSFWVTLHCVKGKKLSLPLDLDKSSLTPRILAKRGIFTPSPTLQDGEKCLSYSNSGISPFVPRWCLIAHFGVTQ